MAYLSYLAFMAMIGYTLKATAVKSRMVAYESHSIQ